MAEPTPGIAGIDSTRRRLLVGLLLGLLSGRAHPNPVEAPDLVANGILLPGLVDSAESGTLIDLVRVLDQHYSTGRIKLAAYPVARALTNVGSGAADLVFPAMRLSPQAEAKLPYRFSSEAIGRVSFVLYSHRDLPLTRDDLFAAARRGQPYSVEAPPFSDWGFPARQLVGFESAFRKLSARRIDAVLWAQEEADAVLRALGLRDIRRAHFLDYDDVFILPRGPRGDFVDRVLSRAIKSLRASGRLAPLFQRVHRPYQDWQPGTAK